MFVLPVLFALFLQAMYGAVDLLVVGRFAGPEDVSAVSTGSQIMLTLTDLVSSFAMGLTIFLGQKIGEKNTEFGGRIIGSGIIFFLIVGAVLTVLIPVTAPALADVMHAPPEAYDKTVSYIRICGLGSIVIIGYNLIGSIFRGMGDSRTPLVTVLIACIFNIAGDLLLVKGFDMGASGAAAATVAAQFISVIISCALIRRKTLPFDFGRSYLRLRGDIIRKIVALGTPIALQDLLVSISFLVVLAIVNGLGLVASAGVGVAEKVCAFIMLVPLSFMQAMSAFVAQNRGAGRIDRAYRGLMYAIGVSVLFGISMFCLSFFHGEMLSRIFANDSEVVAASADYLKAYAIDCLLTCFLFCFIGFFNGMEYTGFVMLQGIIGAFLVRVPVSFAMSRWEPVSLFHIGLATPCSTILQITMCTAFMLFTAPKSDKDGAGAAGTR